MTLSCSEKHIGLLRRITSNHNGDFCCLNCFHPYTTEKKFRKHEKMCKVHDFCDIKMPDEDEKILKYIFGEKIIKISFYRLCGLRMFTSENKYISK